jgi:cytochrome c nitrite reductase small subunit
MRDHYDNWQKASHHHVAVCNDCHTPHNLAGKYAIKAWDGFWHSKAFTLQDFHEPIIITPLNRAVTQNTCIDCHREFVADIADHGRGADTLRCVHCHAAVGHGPPR